MMVRSTLDPPKRTPEAERRVFGLPRDALPEPTTEWREWNGLEALYLGDIIVGRVAPTGGGRHGDTPRGIFNLAAIENSAFWVGYPTVKVAKCHIETRLDDWLRRAGLA
jgi:hypothetical protein